MPTLPLVGLPAALVKLQEKVATPLVVMLTEAGALAVVIFLPLIDPRFAKAVSQKGAVALALRDGDL